MIQPTLTMDQYQKLLDMFGQSYSCIACKIVLNVHFSSSWVLDSGATYYICHDLSSFNTYHLIDSIDNTKLFLMEGNTNYSYW